MATKQREPKKKDLTILEVDSRIHDLVMRFLESDGDLSTSQVIGFLRVAYSQGYIDCLKEPEGQRGKWIKDLGYGVRGVEL